MKCYKAFLVKLLDRLQHRAIQQQQTPINNNAIVSNSQVNLVQPTSAPILDQIQHRLNPVTNQSSRLTVTQQLSTMNNSLVRPFNPVEQTQKLNSSESINI